MPTNKKPVASNSERGLELHANPLGPKFPLLKALPKAPRPNKQSSPKPKSPRKKKKS